MKLKRLVFVVAMVVTAFAFIYLYPSGVFADITNGYQVYKSTDVSSPVTTVSNLSDAFTYVNGHADSDQWIIKATGDDSDVGSSAATLNAVGATVTLTSDSGIHTLTQMNAAKRHIDITAGNLVMKDIILDGSSVGGGVSMGSNAAITMNSDSTIQNCKASQGGGICCGGDGLLTLNSGATITGCQSTFTGTGGSGAGVYSNGTVILNAGSKITGNTANGGKGGGIAICYSAGSLTMNGGEISENQVLGYSSDYLGGGVAVYGGAAFLMYDGKITGNKSDIGGGIALWDFGGIGSSFTMYDGEISKNDTTFTGYHCYGGAIFAWSYAACAIDIEGGQIHDNSAKQGGGIMTYDGSNLMLNNDAVIYNNTATYGGGIFTTASNGTINDNVSIYNNTATYGGGVYINAGTLIMNDESGITGNSATLGGGVYARENLIMNGAAAIYENTASSLGGGIYARANLTLNDDSMVKKNVSSSAGGGVFLYNTAVFEMTGGSLTKNHAGTYGGGVAVYGVDSSCKLTMTAAGAPEIYANIADQAGDDVYGNGTNTSITLISVPEMQLPASVIANNWFVDQESARYRDITATKDQYSGALSGITGTIYLTVGIQYSLSYDTNGATSGTAPVDTNGPYGYDSTATALSGGDLAKTGYTFASWNTSADGSGLSYAIEDTFSVTANTVLYAQWDVNTYIVEYNANGGSGTMADQEITYDVATDLTGNTFERDGYTFAGWNTKKDGSGTSYVNEAEVKNLTAVNDATVPLYAQWIPNGTPPALNSTDHFKYVVGYPDGTVQPEGDITRAEVTTIFYRLLTASRRDEIFTSTNDFSDVTSSLWYNKAASSMEAGDYVYGYPDGTFLGDLAITRAEFIAIAVRFLNVDTTSVSTVGLSDVSTDHWAYDEIATAEYYGWVSGYTDGTFQPDDPITRAEAMTIINRMLNRGVDASGVMSGFKVWPDNDSTSWSYYEVIEATNDHEYTGSRPNESWTSLTTNYTYDIVKYERP